MTSGAWAPERRGAAEHRPESHPGEPETDLYGIKPELREASVGAARPPLPWQVTLYITLSLCS